MTQQSKLFTNLVDAFQNDYFTIQPYKDEMGNNNEALDQILLQQYSYWLISTWMDIVVEYGPPLEVVEEEWELYTPALLQEKQPSAYVLCVDSLTDVLAAPRNLPEYDDTTDTTAAAAEDQDQEPDNKDPDKEEEEDEKEDIDGGNPWDDEEGVVVVVETSEVEEEEDVENAH